MVRIDLPDEICNGAEKYLNLSGYASVSECARDQVRRWAATQEVNEKAPELSKSDVLRENTIRTLLPTWMSNFRQNVQLAFESKDMYAVENIEKIKNAKSAIIIGAGPSLKKYNHLNMLAKSDYKGLVIACDRILISCLEAGVVPDIVVTIDGDATIMDFYNSPLVGQYADKIQAIFSTTAHPDAVHSWSNKDTLHFMNCHMDTMETPISLSKGMWLMANKTMMQTGGNVGMTGWFLAHALHKAPLCLIGVDLSHPAPCDLQEIESYQTYFNMHAGDMDKVIKCFRRDYNPFFKNESITHYVWDTYFEVARSWMAALYKQHGVMTYNCTGGGIMHSFEGMEQMHFQDFLEEHKI